MATDFYKSVNTGPLFINDSVLDSVRLLRQHSIEAGLALWQHDFLAEWRELKLEREV